MEHDNSFNNPVIVTSNKIGNYNGTDYEFWKDNKGNAIMTVRDNGAFTCKWNNINNVLFRTGKKFRKNNKVWSTYGNIILNYICKNYKPLGNSYLGVYGWSTNPLIEYYIIDDWGTWKPPGKNIPKGRIEIDGGIYDIYESTRRNQPSINGTKTFQQYWSVRTEKRKNLNLNSVISVSKHFESWEKLGMKLGNLYEVSLVVEGYQSNGEAEIGKVIIDINTPTPITPTPTPIPITPTPTPIPITPTPIPITPTPVTQMGVIVTSSPKDVWNGGYGGILTIDNKTNNKYTNWEIICDTTSTINWSDNLKIFKENNKITLTPQSYCPSINPNSKLLINFGGTGTIPIDFTFNEKSNSQPVDPINPSKPIDPVIPPQPVNPVIKNKKTFGYFSEWSIYGRKFSVEQIPAQNLTHIMYAFMLPNPSQSDLDIFKKYSSYPPLPYYPPPQKPEGSLVTHDEYANQINIQKLITLKQKYPHIKLIMSVGGWTLSWTFSKVVKDPKLRKNLVDSCIDFCIKNNFDGIDIDWEYVGKQGIGYNYVDTVNDTPNFILFLKELREQMNIRSPIKYLEITAATGCDPVVINNYKGTEPYLDYMLLMTYDFSGAWDTFAGNFAGLYYDPKSKMNPEFNIHSSVENAKKIGYPSNKICVGIPMYGRGWNKVDIENPNAGIYGPATGAANSLSGSAGEPGLSSWKDMRDVFKNTTTWSNNINNTAVSAWTYNKNTKETWSYETPETARIKAQYVVDNNLGGCLFWELSDDTRDGKENILTEVVNIFNK
jgi:GH18 family chitinase